MQKPTVSKGVETVRVCLQMLAAENIIIQTGSVAETVHANHDLCFLRAESWTCCPRLGEHCSVGFRTQRKQAEVHVKHDIGKVCERRHAHDGNDNFSGSAANSSLETEQLLSISRCVVPFFLLLFF